MSEWIVLPAIALGLCAFWKIEWLIAMVRGRVRAVGQLDDTTRQYLGLWAMTHLTLGVFWIMLRATPPLDEEAAAGLAIMGVLWAVAALALILVDVGIGVALLGLVPDALRRWWRGPEPPPTRAEVAAGNAFLAEIAEEQALHRLDERLRQLEVEYRRDNAPKRGPRR